MNLLRLKLVNFRVFNGHHEMEFSNNKKKNVTLIHAENSMGKSTVLNAIKWCLYCKTPDFDSEINKPNHPPHVRLANLDSMNESEGGGNFEVELEFEHEGVSYRAHRVANQRHMSGIAVIKGKDVFTLFKLVNGNSNSMPEPQSTINSILPEELSDYFLFSGEIVSKTLDVSSNKGHGYKKAVRDILGFTLSDIAIEDLEKIKKSNTTKKLQILKANELTKGVSDEILKLRNEEQHLAIQLSDLKIERDDLIRIDEGCTEKIQNSNHKVAENLVRERKYKESKEEQEKKRLNILLSKKSDLIGRYGNAVFGFFLIDKMSFIKKESFRGKIPASYQESFVTPLLEKETCICGRDIKKGTQEFKNVSSLLDLANTEIINERVQKSFSVCDGFKGRVKNFIVDMGEVSKEYEECEAYLAALRKSIDSLDDEIQNIGDHDISDILAKQQRTRSMLKGKRNDISDKGFLLKHKISEIGQLNKRLEKLQVNNPQIDFRDNFDRVIGVVISRLKKNQAKAEKDALGIISSTIQKNLNAYLRKEFTAKIDSNYNIHLYYKDTDTLVTGTGEGQDILTKLSFITALISHSKLRSSSKNGWSIPGTIAPFVIDAPFANMDKKYQKATLSFLPKQSHQLVIFLSSGQLPDGYEEILSEYIGKRYYFENHVTADADVEDEFLNIKGKPTYPLVIRDWDGLYSSTQIKEINQ